MMVREEIFLLILACMVVTVIPRILPMALVNRMQPPRWFLLWLQYIPVSVIAALLFPQVLLLEGDWREWNDPYFLAAFPTLAVAFWSRNIFAAIMSGVVIFTALRLLL